MWKIKSLQKLINELSRLPGLGPKSAERLAYFILKQHHSYAQNLAEAILEVKKHVIQCPICHNFTEQTPCWICEDSARDRGLLCVVEDPSTIFKLEKTGTFRGYYHVLHGAINPLQGITPESLNISSLLNRLQQSFNSHPVREVIFAFDADLEGDTTALYLQECLASFPIKLSRLAQGIPLGGSMHFLDERTLSKALQNRVEIPSHSGFDRE
ncbi:MAG: recombination mediator RecR [Bdellovibrionaceae bacterium]|nr:recombination mediator RecR [Pseudobdellovibrionaceae bacterium]MDW8189704.1 recombination mediator RecR [Pseudobdellovibrionaceae bacterium]